MEWTAHPPLVGGGGVSKWMVEIVPSVKNLRLEDMDGIK